MTNAQFLYYLEDCAEEIKANSVYNDEYYEREFRLGNVLYTVTGQYAYSDSIDITKRFV